MLPRTKTPTTGRLVTLGWEGLGQFAGKIYAVEHAIGLSRHHFASFADGKCDGVKGGARFTASACRVVAGMIKENISTGGRNLPTQWPDLSTEYRDKKEKYVGGLGQWRLKDIVLHRVGVQKRRGEAGRSVGIYGKDRVPKINFSVMSGWHPTKSIYPSQYAFWNEFGTDPTKYSGGQPPRPVFIPTFQQFARKYLPTLADAICDSLEEDYKRLKKNVDKPSSMHAGPGLAGKLRTGHRKPISEEFREDVVLGGTYFESAEGGDAYQKQLKKIMAASGANKWLAEHAEELGD